MKKSYNKNFLMGCLLSLSFGITAQAQEIGIRGASFANFQNKSIGVPTAQVTDGVILGLDYTQYLNDHWSIGTGIEILSSRFDYRENSLSNGYNTTDMEGDNLEFKFTANNVYNTVNWRSYRIPITFQYETSGMVSKWYVRTGAVIGLKSTNVSYVLAREVGTTGYYPQWDALLEGPNFAGFGTFPYPFDKGEVKFDKRFSWIFETGIKRQVGLKGQNSLYIGAFLDWGFNNIRSKENVIGNFIEYTANVHEPLDYNGVWTLDKYQDKQLKNFIVGLTVRYGIGLKQKAVYRPGNSGSDSKH